MLNLPVLGLPRWAPSLVRAGVDGQRGPVTNNHNIRTSTTTTNTNSINTND